MKDYKGICLRAIGLLIVMTIICGVIYTIIVSGIGHFLFQKKTNGSIIEVDGVKYGCELLAQEFSDENHMWGRVMNVTINSFKDQKGNYVMYSVPSNLSPKSKEFKEIVEDRIKIIQETNPDMKEEKIPVDLLTCSGSGLDPDISVAAAKYQIPRIAKNNGISEEKIEDIIEQCTTKKVFKIFGQETVNVLKVNLMLEGILE